MAIGVALLGLTVAIQAAFTLAGMRCLDWLESRKRRFTHRHAMLMIMFFVLLMFLAVVLDVWLWAGFYYGSEKFQTFEEALYFSTTTFTTLGYGDIIPAKEWRLLASFEAANGLIIFGWATAFVVAAIERFYLWLGAKK